MSSNPVFSKAPDAAGGRKKRDDESLNNFEDELRDEFDDDEDDGEEETSQDDFDEEGYVNRIRADSISNAVALFADQPEDVQECVREVVQVSLHGTALINLHDNYKVCMEVYARFVFYSSTKKLRAYSIENYYIFYSHVLLQLIQDHFSDRNAMINAQGLENVRRALSVTDKLEELINNLITNLAGFRPPENCTRTVVRLNTCGRCLRPRPSFCRNVCHALARACYSPFQTAFRDQFEELWVVIRSITSITDDTLDKLEDNDLFDTTSTSLVSLNCVYVCMGQT